MKNLNTAATKTIQKKTPKNPKTNNKKKEAQKQLLMNWLKTTRNTENKCNTTNNNTNDTTTPITNTEDKPPTTKPTVTTEKITNTTREKSTTATNHNKHGARPKEKSTQQTIEELTNTATTTKNQKESKATTRNKQDEKQTTTNKPKQQPVTPTTIVARARQQIVQKLNLNEANTTKIPAKKQQTSTTPHNKQQNKKHSVKKMEKVTDMKTFLAIKKLERETKLLASQNDREIPGRSNGGQIVSRYTCQPSSANLNNSKGPPIITTQQRDDNLTLPRYS